MMRYLCCLLCLISVLSANWEEYLAPCENKDGQHRMDEIDFIYLINLNVRPKKLERCLKELSPYGINPYRFEAINGWHMDRSHFAFLGCPGLLPGMIPGKAACVLSHLSVMSDAYAEGYETVWIMEDDIEVMSDPLQIPSLIRELDQLVDDWDILYTDSETKDFYGNRVPCMAIHPRPNVTPEPLEFYLKRKVLNEKFLEVGMRYGCYSMIIRRSGLKKILDYFAQNRLYLPIDMELFFVPDLKQIVLRNDLISTRPGTKSDTTVHYLQNEE